MADTKITQLATLTSLSDDDLIVLADNVATVPVNKSARLDNFRDYAVTQAVVGAALYPQTQAEIDAGVTPVDYSYPFANVLRNGFSTAGTAAANAAALQAAINSVAHAGHGNILIPRGRYDVDASAVYFHYDVTNNPNFPSSANLQGNITLIGEGRCDGTAFQAGLDQGTMLDVGADTLLFGNGTAAMRCCRLENMTVVGNNATVVVKWDFVSRNLGWDNISVFQEGVGDGIELDDTFNVQCGYAHVQTTNGSNTGRGIYAHNSSQAAGIYLFDHCNCIDFAKNWVIGEEGTSASSMNSIVMRGCQGKGGDYNLIIGNGAKSMSLDGFHNEEMATVGVLLAYGAANVTIRNMYSSAQGASADYLHIGLDAGTAAQTSVKDCLISNSQFVSILNSGIKVFASANSLNNRIDYSSFTGSGAAVGITIENDVMHGLIVGPNLYSGLATDVTNTARIDIHYAGDTLGRVTLAGPQTFTNEVVMTDGELALPTATTSQLADIAHAINTSTSKVEGSTVFNTTTNKPVYAVGNADGDVWVDATGATVHTPV